MSLSAEGRYGDEEDGTHEEDAEVSGSTGASVWWRLHLDPLLLAELRQRLFDAECSEAGGAVGVPTLPHDLGHHP